MNRYEWKQISPLTWGLWDPVRRIYLIETTQAGMEAYKRLGF